MCVFLHSIYSISQGFLGRPLRGRFSTVLLRRYLTMMLCTVDFGMCSSCPIDPSDLPSFQRSTTRWRCRTLCSLVFRQSGASVGAQRLQTVDTDGAASGLAAAASSEWVEQYQSSKYSQIHQQPIRGRRKARLYNKKKCKYKSDGCFISIKSNSVDSSVEFLFDVLWQNIRRKKNDWLNLFFFFLLR